MKVFLALACLVVSLGSLRAQTDPYTVGWFFPPDSSSLRQSWASNYTGSATAVLETPVVATVGSGLGTWPGGPARTWRFSLPSTLSFEQAIANNRYIEFTLTPSNGFSTQMAYLNFSASMITGPLSVGLFSSEAGFETQHQLGETFVISSTNSAAPNFVQFNNSGDAFYDSAVTYRVYFTTAGTNHFYLGDSSGVGWSTNEQGMTVIGYSTPSIVPEPSAFGALCGVAGFWLSTVVFTVSRKRRQRVASR